MNNKKKTDYKFYNIYMLYLNLVEYALKDKKPMKVPILK